MKKFWMLWISLMTAVVLLSGAYYFIHGQNEKQRRFNTIKFCSESSLKAADRDTFDPNKVKTEYDYLYMNCLRTHQL